MVDRAHEQQACYSYEEVSHATTSMTYLNEVYSV